MPRFPSFSPALAQTRASPYSALASRLAAFEGQVFPLHVGDTYLEPAPGTHMQDLRTDGFDGLHRYTSPHGLPALRDRIAERVQARTGVPTERDSVLVTAGGTGGLGAVAGALLAPGDEVLIAAPYWPLIAGIVRSFHGVAVPVPLMDPAASADAVVAAFEAHRTERTVAVYLNTPNNPTGAVYPAAWVRGLAEFARAADLWLWSDEIYEDYAYRGEHAYARAYAPERTFSAYSFSKAYGMAGNRVGYIVGPTAPLQEVLKVSTHTFYSAPTAGQVAALRVLGPEGDDWIAGAREAYDRLGQMAASALGVPAPAGSTFLFLDVAPHLDERGLSGLLEDLVARGLLVAPGSSFGPFPTHIRVCFTCAPPAVVEQGVEILARRLGR